MKLFRRAILPALTLVGAMAVAGCSTIAVLAGKTSDCASAEKRLTSLSGALSAAQDVLNAAVKAGAPAPIEVAQGVVTMISADVAATQALVGNACAPPAPAMTMIARARVAGPITLDQAKRRAKADRQLVEDLKARGN